MNTKICPSCQKENPSDVQVCVHCGAPMVASKQSNTTIPVPENVGRISHPEHIVQLVRLYADIIVFQVLGNEQPILIKEPTRITIGRFNPGETPPTIDLTPYSGNLLGVSRLHAVITRSPKGYALEDLESTNGTWLNEVKLTPHQAYDLRNGDLIRFGQLAVYTYFRMGDAAPALEETIRLKNQLADTAFRLTPHNLETAITPYLNALAGVQSICAKLRQQPETDVAITAVSADAEKAQVEIRLIGAKQAVRLIKEHIAPWRETYTAKIAYLAAKGAASEQPENNGTTGQLRREMREAELALASQILAELAPGYSEDEQKAQVEKLLPYLHTLSFSALHIVPT